MAAQPQKALMMKRAVLIAISLVVILIVYPIEYRWTRIVLLLGIIVSFAGSLYVFWNSKAKRLGLIIVGSVPLIFVSLPERSIDRDALRSEYTGALRTFAGTRYVWGGESYLGIDCSGLVRKPLVLACLRKGLRTMNGGLIRTACWFWWHGASASALRDRYADYTIPSGSGKSINLLDGSVLKPGDLATTADGIHVLAYLGNQEWIQADPQVNRVVRMASPSTNSWFDGK